MLIVEDLFLLLTRDDGKPVDAFVTSRFGLVAAAITDLILAERVTLSDDKDPRVQVVSAAPTDHPVLDRALERLVDKDGKRLSSLLQDNKIAPERNVVASLERAGVIDVEPKRMLGLVPERRPTRDAGPERHLRQRLRAAIQGSEVTPREATLLAILSALDIAHKVLPEEAGGLRKRELKKRIAQVSTDLDVGEAMNTAVKRAVDAMNAAIIAAVVVPAAATGGNGGA